MEILYNDFLACDTFPYTVQHPLIRRHIIRTFANSNGFLIPLLLFPLKIHPIIRTFARYFEKFFRSRGMLTLYGNVSHARKSL